MVVPLPLGLACVAAATENAGHEVRILVLPAESDYERAIRDSIQQVSPEVIGVSVRNIDDQNMQSPRFLLDSVKPVVTACRAYSSAPIVLGGAGYSIFPRSVLAYLGADIGIRGEGESAFPALLSWLSHGRRSSPPPSTYFADGLNTSVSFVRDLDAFPLPKKQHWLKFPQSIDMRIPVQSRRGCPLDCSFCSTSSIEGRPIRQRSPDSVVNWLAVLRRQGFRHFWFVDNTFNLPPSYAKELCRKLITADLRLDWWAIVYPKWVDAELVDLMVEAGCTEVSLGFESGSDIILPVFNKRFTCAEVKTASDALGRVGIKRNGFLMLGGPEETTETVEQSLAFADSLNLDMLKITVGIRIYPDTPLAARAIADGLLSPDDNLLLPRFYMLPALRHWLPLRITSRENGFA
jgi:radical SAM superfamily enzyme YgiQ (UPF0313 family)